MENQTAPQVTAVPAPPAAQPLCPKCHVPVGISDFFCRNCGQNLKPTPPSTTLTAQIELYGKSLLLPPLGFIWGFKYLRQPDTKSKLVGLITIVMTIAVLIFIVVSTVKLINTVNEQVNSQLEQMAF